MKRIFLFFVFGLFLSLPLQAAEPKVHVVVAADGRAGFGANLMADYNNIERLFKGNVPKERLNFIALERDEIIPDKILQTISRIELSAEDTLIFYYSGNAAGRAGTQDDGTAKLENAEAGNGGQFFQLKDEQGKPVELFRRTLLAQLKEKKARLTVLLTDCSNIEEVSSSNKTDSDQKTGETLFPPETLSPIFEALFMKPTGIVDITSSKRGEASFADSTGKNRGSCFTAALMSLFEKHRNNGTITWSDFTAELKTEVHKSFLESHPQGFKFEPPLNGIVRQNTQTIEIYGELPGAQSVVAYQGPRFGVRAASIHSGGVRVTQIVPGGPGAKAGFEVGDIILEINGKPIQNEEDYSKSIDDSPKMVNAKIVNVKDGRTLNVTFELGY